MPPRPAFFEERACMRRSQFQLAAGPDFNFWRTVTSHGWYDLPPFSCDPARRTLGRILTTPRGTPVATRVRQDHAGLRVVVESDGPLDRVERRSLRSQLSTCLRLEEDLGEFHALARRSQEWAWVAKTRSGRLLRSPTVFEDAVKMICTTNCTWALTRIMATGLVNVFGAAMSDGRRAFPTAAAIAGSTERVLRRECSTGYRAPYILEFSRRVASGDLDPERWRDLATSEEVLYRDMRTVKGIGDYAAGNLLKLVGRYQRLGLDSWVRQRYAVIHHRGRKVSDRTIERHYRNLGAWRGMFFWLEMTRDWHDEEPIDHRP